MSQKELGRKIGKSHSTINRYESSTLEPPFHVIVDIARVLDVSVSEFTQGDNMKVEKTNWNLAKKDEEEKSDILQSLNDIADSLGGKIEMISGPLPDDSGFAVMSIPLPKNHWLTQSGDSEPPMPIRIGTDDSLRNGMTRIMWKSAIKAAGEYAIRVSTDNGKIIDFDPDAMVQNFIIGMIGYETPDGKR